MKKLFANTLATSTLTVSLCLPLMVQPVYASNSIKQEIRGDHDYQGNVARARSMLQARGYQAEKIDAEQHLGQKALEIAARKNGYRYDIVLSYPTLKIIKEQRDD